MTFGNTTLLADRVRGMRRVAWIDRLCQDVGYALRALRRTPIFTLTAVATLVVGIGANAVMLDVIDRLFVRAPAGIRDPQAVARLWLTRPEPRDYAPVTSYVFYAALRDGLVGAADLATYSRYEYSLGTGTNAVKVRAAHVSDSYFRVLGTRPALGTLLGPADGDRRAEALVVLSHAFWRRQFGGDPSIVGRPVRIGKGTFAVTGVAEPGFIGTDIDAVDVWLPVGATGDWFSKDWRTQTGDYWYQIIGRLSDAARVTEVEARASGLLAAALDARHDLREWRRISAHPLVAAQATGDAATTPWIAAISVLVFFIACANTAMLFHVRAIRRAPEIGTRLALGASRSRIVGQLFAETLIVSSVASVGAGFVMSLGRQGLAATLLPDVGVLEAPTDVRSVVMVVGLALLAGILCGSVPSLRLLMSPPTLALGRPSHAGNHLRPGRLLGVVALQTALVVPALVGAGLFLASLRAAMSVDLGFEPEGLVLVYADLRFSGHGDPAELSWQMLDRIRQLPQVQGAALATGQGSSEPTLMRQMSFGGVSADGRAVEPPPYGRAVSFDYLPVLGTRILEGRGLTPADDRPGALPVVVVSQSLARAVWPGHRALGQCLAWWMGCMTVIGVAEDGQLPGTNHDGYREFFVPVRAHSEMNSGQFIVARSTASVSTLAPLVRSAVASVDPNLPFIQVMPATRVFEPLVRPWRVGAMLFSTLAVIALVVAAVGLCGVVGYITASQQREAAIRLALGASPRRLSVTLVGRAVGAVVVGLVAGVGLALAGGRAVASQLFGVQPHDPVVLGLAVTTLLISGILAAYLPARHLETIEPATLLRAE